MFNRREIVAGLASCAGLSLLRGNALAADRPSGSPKRVIFFLQKSRFSKFIWIVALNQFN